MEIQQLRNNLDGLAINFNNVGLTYKKMGDYENALKEFRLGLELEKRIDFPILKGAIFNNIGNIFELQEAMDSALYYQRKSLQIGKITGYNELIGWANKGIASVYLSNGNLDGAVSHGTTGYEIGVKTNTQDLSKQSAEVLHQAYARKREFQRAYLYFRLFKEHSDNMLNAQSIKKTAALEYEYQNEQSNRIQALELQAQEALYLSQINEQKKIRNQILAGLILMAAILSIMWISYWQKRRVNRELEEKNRIISDQAQNLEQLNETKDRFFSIISHDLRGPMAIFQGFSFMVKTMLEDKKYEKLEKFSDEVGKVSKQLSELLDNLLNWALKQQGQFPYHPEKLNLKECVDENLGIFNSMASSKKIELKCEVLPNSFVWADKNSLMTIIRNLINNALKFTEPEGKIGIHCGQEEDFIAVKFSDSGVGIAEDKLASLFTFQEKKASIGTKGERGVGLGLQLVHDFVKLNKGEIKVQSAPEEGTTFTVLLPPPK
ncbi:MAG: tetratricopeptide repeat-containing sensor histidine kinase, partial [Cyclobacteriaceae bacterium]